MMTDLPSPITTTPTILTAPLTQQLQKSNNKASAKKSTKRRVEVPQNIEKMFETFHQSAKGDFKPTFYNPFEIKHRRRTTKAQYRILESAFKENNKPTASARKVLATKLGMTPRAVQVWFQNRRAKCKGSTDGAESAGSPDVNGQEEEGEKMCMELRDQFDYSQPTRQRTASISSMSISKSSHNASMARRHSMPDMHPYYGSTDTSLPFRELHEAIFGKNRTDFETPSSTCYSQSTRLPSIAEAYPQQRIYEEAPQHEADVTTTAPPAAIMPMIKTRPRKNSIPSNSSEGFMNPNLSTAHIHQLYDHDSGQYMGQMDTVNMPQQMDPSMGFDSLLNAQLSTNPADQHQLSASLPYLDSILMSSAPPAHQSSNAAQFGRHKDMTTPSLSAPNSSPSLLPDDHHLQLMQLQAAISGLHPTNTEMIEAMASRMSPTISPIEMEMILQNAAALNHGKKLTMESLINPSDFFTDLSYQPLGTIDPANPSNEMLICMNAVGHEQYLGYHPLSYASNPDFV